MSALAGISAAFLVLMYVLLQARGTVLVPVGDGPAPSRAPRG